MTKTETETETDRADMAVCRALATGGAADAYNALTAAADAWHRVEATDRAQGRTVQAVTAHRACLFFTYAAADADTFHQNADARAALKHAATYGREIPYRVGQMSDYRGGCRGLFGGAY